MFRLKPDLVSIKKKSESGPGIIPSNCSTCCHAYEQYEHIQYISSTPDTGLTYRVWDNTKEFSLNKPV